MAKQTVRATRRSETFRPTNEANGNLFSSGGELGERIRVFDWSQTPMGPISSWPQSLKTVVQMLVTSRFAMWMGWGPELTFLYNDAYARMTLGKKHPWALGRPSREVWAEIWNDISPRIEKVLKTGEATWDQELLLFLERSGYSEETYHTFSYSPLTDDDGTIVGNFCVVTEETDRVIGERRVGSLRSLASELGKTITEKDVFAAVHNSLSANPQDLPFTLTYLFSEDPTGAHLACTTGIETSHRAAPKAVELTSNDQGWPLAEVVNRKDSVILEDLAQRFGSLPKGAWTRRRTVPYSFPLRDGDRILLQASSSQASIPIARWIRTTRDSSISPPDRSRPRSPTLARTMKSASALRPWRKSIAQRRPFSPT